ncbi:MAG: hypothetical protein ACI4QT_03110 [Kiritimatiellia bacterium]
MKTLRILPIILLTISAQAEWISTQTTANYLDANNWRDEICDDTFSGTNAPLERTVLALENDHIVAPNGLRVLHQTNAPLVIEGANGPRSFNFRDGGKILVDIGAPSDEVAMRTGAQNSETKRIDFDFGDNPAIVSISSETSTSGRDTLSCFGSIRGASFHRKGNGFLKLYGAIETSSGSAEFSGGVTYLYSWGVSGTHGLPSLQNLTLGNSAKLSLESAISPQIITLAGGFLQSTATITAENLKLQPGLSGIIARGSSKQFFNTLSRHNNAFLTLGATDSAQLGSTAFIRFGEDLSSNLVGGGAAFSTTPDSSRVSIVPWAGVSSFSTAETFYQSTDYLDPALPVTYTADAGFVTIPESSMHTNELEQATIEDNVLLTDASITLETDSTVNCLVFKNWGSTIDLAEHNLSIGSGLILHRNTKPTIKNGTIVLGTEPLRILGRQTLTCSSRITSANTDPDKIVMITSSASGGGVVLSGDNTGLVGVIQVASGTLAANHEKAVPPTLSVELASSASYPVVWGGTTTRARGIGGTGSIQAGDAKNRLLLGDAPSTAATGVFVGTNGFIAPGERDSLTGRRSGNLSVGDKFSTLVFQENSTFEISIFDDTTATALVAPTASVTLGGNLVLKDPTPNRSLGEWIILSAKPDAAKDTVTGAFDSIPAGFKVSLVSTEGYDTVNAVSLSRNVKGSLIILL